MNRDKAMAEAYGDFIGRIGAVFDPVSRVADGLLHVRCDPVKVYTDVASSRTISPRPIPHVAKHPSVQFAQKSTIEYIALASFGPAEGLADIDLFGLIQLVSQRDVGRDELFSLLGCEGRVCMVVVIEQRIRQNDPVPRPTGPVEGRPG